jgi:hypothetical protein
MEKWMEKWEVVAINSPTFRLKIDGGYLYQVDAWDTHQVVFVPDSTIKQHEGDE